MTEMILFVSKTTTSLNKIAHRDKNLSSLASIFLQWIEKWIVFKIPIIPICFKINNTPNIMKEIVFSIKKFLKHIWTIQPFRWKFQRSASIKSLTKSIVNKIHFKCNTHRWQFRGVLVAINHKTIVMLRFPQKTFPLQTIFCKNFKTNIVPKKALK